MTKEKSISRQESEYNRIGKKIHQACRSSDKCLLAVKRTIKIWNSPADVLELRLEGGLRSYASPLHVFFTSARKAVPASKLEPGDCIWVGVTALLGDGMLWTYNRKNNRRQDIMIASANPRKDIHKHLKSAEEHVEKAGQIARKAGDKLGASDLDDLRTKIDTRTDKFSPERL